MDATIGVTEGVSLASKRSAGYTLVLDFSNELQRELKVHQERKKLLYEQLHK